VGEKRCIHGHARVVNNNMFLFDMYMTIEHKAIFAINVVERSSIHIRMLKIGEKDFFLYST
jgi:hypothetical protein